ncbi:MAG: gamma-glutamylcyclotransferase [Marinosulfonomonas sp.]
MEKSPLWIFGYGSLMWEPGFEYDDRLIAGLDGYARSFCMRSIHHRGTPEVPGLVLALDKVEQAKCMGLALRVREGHEAKTLDYLRERELISSAYLEASVELALSDNRRVEATTFIVDTDHVQYCHGLALEEQANIIATAVGGRGPNTEYLHNTTTHLRELGIYDPDLDWLSNRVHEIAVSANA